MTLRRYTKLIAAAAALTLAAAVPAVADPDSIEVSTATVVEDAESLDVQEDPEDGNIESDDDAPGGNDDDGAGSEGVGDESELGGEGLGDPEVQESDGDSDISLLTLPSEPTTITIANITDFHGRIDGPGGAARLLRGGQPGGAPDLVR